MAKFFTGLIYLSIALGVMLVILSPEFLEAYPEIAIILLIVALVSVPLSYHFGITRAPIKTTRARVLKKHGDRSLSVKFKFPDKKTLNLNAGTWDKYNSVNVGDIIDLKYKGWEVISMKKVNPNSRQVKKK